MTRLSPPSLDPAEVEKFSQLAAQWWDPRGKFGMLHKFNPVRLEYIREQATARFRRDPFAHRPLEGLTLLDIGCGGGLLSEPMTRLGATVTGVDPSERNISTASVHAAELELAIDYRTGIAEDLARSSERFDIILAMEVIEHVPDPSAFIATCAGLLNPGGLLLVATLNRTLKSFAMAIVGAEYVLGWLPRGTHQWEKFIAPAELEGWVAANGLTPLDRTGVVYNPISSEWRKSRDTDVNYMIVAQKPRQTA
jgi:2-polyprenyl-6-hydroxyphenyl methylase / 3-demethylubiquinone-9 3-methyltransferase